MNINSRQFIGSFNTLSELPEIDIPEFCFIGRSNVGKSSLINYLTGKNDLAKVSSTPGKTQSLNYFLINKQWHLVDLPGYGYAKRSKTLRSSWEKTMYTYFETREALVNIFLLIDSRIKPMKSDLDMINWLGENGVPFSIVYTKADTRELKQCKINIELFENKLKETWEELPESFITSSEERKGKEEILDYIHQIANS
ncbi:MAG: ribosome biogenesis GTP-binding protein YihA/YsxC [Chitinophagales bacterium]|jgi:GTP-binding protein|nr:ribosome biogenesis GTP-binding protein YihA/YsxC [Sphingobacteriales bacterium]